MMPIINPCQKLKVEHHANGNVTPTPCQKLKSQDASNNYVLGIEDINMPLQCTAPPVSCTKRKDREKCPGASHVVEVVYRKEKENNNVSMMPIIDPCQKLKVEHHANENVTPTPCQKLKSQDSSNNYVLGIEDINHATTMHSTPCLLPKAERQRKVPRRI